MFRIRIAEGWRHHPEYLPGLRALADGRGRGLAPERLVDAIAFEVDGIDLAAGRARGLTGVDGLAMLIGQARPSFEALFGAPPPLTPMLVRSVKPVLSTTSVSPSKRPRALPIHWRMSGSSASRPSSAMTRVS